jgi:hypothetical protein
VRETSGQNAESKQDEEEDLRERVCTCLSVAMELAGGRRRRRP